jgi:Ca2+-binding EF-hand superfamily protein
MARRVSISGNAAGAGVVSQVVSKEQLAQAHVQAEQAQAALAKAQTRFAKEKSGEGKQAAAASLQSAAAEAAARARTLEEAARQGQELSEAAELSTSQEHAHSLSPAGTGRRSELSMIAANVRQAFRKAAKGIQRDVAKGKPFTGRTELKIRKDSATGQLSCREPEALRWLFAEFDIDGDEELDSEEFKELVDSAGHQLNEEEHRVLLSCFDEDGSGAISLTEFVTFVTGSPEGEEIGVIADRIRQALSVSAGGGFEGSASAAGLKKVFADFDVNNDGEIDQVELKQALARSGIQLTAAESSLLMRRIDTNKSGAVSFSEFVNFVQPARPTPLLLAQVAALVRTEMRKNFDPSPQRLFDLFDEDSNGYVGLNELRIGVNLHLGLSPKLTDVEVANAMKELDKDGDGAIEATEFERMVEIYGGTRAPSPAAPAVAASPAPVPQSALKDAAAAARVMAAAAAAGTPTRPPLAAPGTPKITIADESVDYVDAPDPDGSMAYSMTGDPDGSMAYSMTGDD